MKTRIITTVLLAILATGSFANEHLMTVKLKQKRFSLSISDHIKDSVNAIEITIPVSKKFYNEINVGQELIDKGFRSGSFILKGSFSKWSMVVTNKNIKQ